MSRCIQWHSAFWRSVAIICILCSYDVSCNVSVPRSRSYVARERINKFVNFVDNVTNVLSKYLPWESYTSEHSNGGIYNEALGRSSLYNHGHDAASGDDKQFVGPHALPKSTNMFGAYPDFFSAAVDSLATVLASSRDAENRTVQTSPHTSRSAKTSHYTAELKRRASSTTRGSLTNLHLGNADNSVEYVCNGGFYTVSNNYVFCIASFLSVPILYSMSDYIRLLKRRNPSSLNCYLPPDDVSFVQMCICPADHFTSIIDNQANCAPRHLHLELTPIEPKKFDSCFTSHPTSYFTQYENSHDQGTLCLSAKRHDHVSLSFKPKFTFLPDEVESEHSKSQSTVYTPSASTIFVDVNQQTVDTYESFVRGTGSYCYIYPTSSSDGKIIGFTYGNQLLSGKIINYPFSFNNPDLMEPEIRELDISGCDDFIHRFDLHTDGGLLEFSFDLGSLSDEFIESGQIYFEYGALSNGIVNYYGVARLHIAITDYKHPEGKFSYKKPLSNALIMLISVVVGSVVIAFLYVSIQFFSTSSEPEDNLVNDLKHSEEVKRTEANVDH